ncbi:ROK family protein [Kribbella sp. NBC_01505]|uniref:ROK family protein n=1 Tax=Kribbella sp. NBC_01505 TaxID=2903580 RepID=UPI00386DB9DA
MPSLLPGGDQSSLRSQNTRRVLQALYDGPSLTIGAVARVTGLSRPTAQAILTALVDDELLILDGFDQVRTGGRPAQRYRFASAAGILGGIDIGAHSVAVRVANLNGALLSSGRRSIRSRLSRAARIDAAVDLLREHAGEGSFWSVGAGTPGVVDTAGVLRLNVALHDWSEVALTDELTERLGCPVASAKETNLAALGEQRAGNAQGFDDVLYVHAGHRLGVGLLVGGTVFTGGKGWAGEIGKHPALGWEDGPAKLHRDVGIAESDGSTEWIFAQAALGDAKALRAVDTFARTLAAGVGAMVLALDPQLVVLGGGIAQAGRALLEPLRQHLAEVCYVVPELVLSALGEQAVAIGAVELAREGLRASLFATGS